MGADLETAKRVLADNVRALRRGAGMSQEALALTADVDRTYVSQIERCAGNPSLGILCRLAEVLSVEPWQLLIQPTRGPAKRKE